MISLRLLTGGYIVVLLGLFLYSFTQIDLSLTFSRIAFLQNIVKSFQYIGYFDRSLSGSLYLILLMALYLFYFVFLFFASKKRVTKAFLWKLIFALTFILAFSYSAFSYDLFNYIFDAKIITHYQQNPYIHKALDFPGDPMLSFMHWTHRVYPYGPFWLVLTVPLSFLGFNLFLPTFFLFKALMASCFVGSAYFVSKIFQKIAPEKENFGLIFFALNPLIMIESLVSSHVDIVMVFFALWAIYLLLNKKYLFAFALLLVSIGIKFATVFLLPVFLFVLFQKQKTKFWEIIFGFAILLMTAAVVAVSLRTNFQPWYLVLAIPFAVFLANRYIVFLPVMILSFSALLTYAPYLYLGNWDKPVPQILTTIMFSAIVLSFVAVISCYAYFVLKQSARTKARLTAQRVTH